MKNFKVRGPFLVTRSIFFILFFTGCATEMKQIQNYAAKSQMIPNAPISAQRSIFINASAKSIWNILTNVKDWGSWYSYLKDSNIKGEFKSGSKIEYGGFLKHKQHLAVVKFPKVIVLYGTYLGFVGITKWKIIERDNLTSEVQFSESSDGLFLSIIYSNKQLEKHLDNWLAALKIKAEENIGKNNYDEN